MQTFADLGEEIPHFKRVQDFSYAHVYSVSLAIINNAAGVMTIAGATLRDAILGIEEDAMFHITHIMGSVIAPCQMTTIFPNREDGDPQAFNMAGCSSGRTDRGIDFRITDLGTGKDLTKASVFSPQAQPFGDFIPFEALFPPGYGFTFFQPVPFEYFLEKGRYLRLQVRNRNTQIDAEGGQGAFVTFAFLGQRMNP